MNPVGREAILRVNVRWVSLFRAYLSQSISPVGPIWARSPFFCQFFQSPFFCPFFQSLILERPSISVVAIVRLLVYPRGRSWIVEVRRRAIGAVTPALRGGVVSTERRRRKHREAASFKRLSLEPSNEFFLRRFAWEMNSGSWQGV